MNRFDNIIKLYTLNIFREGCDQINYKILNMLPSDFKNISKNIGIQKMATARRLNILLRNNLLTWEKRKGKIEPTPLAKELIKIIENIKKGIKSNLPETLQILVEK